MSTSRPRPAFALSALLASAGLFSLTAPAPAQNALGDGRALDRNLQVGSGGLLPGGVRRDPIQDQIRFQNAVISGTATGGKAFRGFSPSRAFDQFGDRLGSDDLYSFRRDAALSGVSGLGVRASDALRYQFSMTTGSPAPFPGDRAAIGGILPRFSSPTSAADTTALRSTSQFLSQRTLAPATVGLRQDEYGAEYTARASPLLGVSWTKTRASPLEAAAQTREGAAPAQLAPQPTLQPNTTTPGLTPNPAATLPALTQQPAPAQAAVSPTGVFTRITQNVRSAAAASPGGPQTQQPRLTFTGQPPADPTPQPARDQTPPDTSIDAQLARLRAMMRGEAPPQPKPPTRPDALNPMGREPAPQQPAQPQPGAQPPTTPGPRLDPILDPRPLRRGEPVSDELRQGLRRSSQDKVRTLIEPGIDTSRGGPVDMSLYTDEMKAGQDRLAQGRFFDAENRFAVALIANPGDPMAKVGRLHAQLGAGLFLSAASNLRDLFAEHPDLVGARYDAALLPSIDRAQATVAQLQTEMDRAGSVLQRDAALLVAYLGHQLADKDMLAAGLEEFARRVDPENPADMALLGLIQAAWSTD